MAELRNLFLEPVYYTNNIPTVRVAVFRVSITSLMGFRTDLMEPIMFHWALLNGDLISISAILAISWRAICSSYGLS